MKLITKSIIKSRIISYQVIGYGILLFLIVGDEVFDFPHLIFGFPATPINWAEALMEGSYIIGLAAFSIYLSLRLLRQLKFLEGFLPICTSCKKIRKDEEWESIEQYMNDHSEAFFSHGLCPECAEKYHDEFNHYDKTGSSDTCQND